MFVVDFVVFVFFFCLFGWFIGDDKVFGEEVVVIFLSFDFVVGDRVEGFVEDFGVVVGGVML